MLFQVKVICLGYTKDIFSESALSKPGIYLVYTRVMTAHFKSCNPSCSKIAIGMQQYTGFGLQGCLMFITARGAPTGPALALGHGPGRRRRRRQHRDGATVRRRRDDDCDGEGIDDAMAATTGPPWRRPGRCVTSVSGRCDPCWPFSQGQAQRQSHAFSHPFSGLYLWAPWRATAWASMSGFQRRRRRRSPCRRGLRRRSPCRRGLRCRSPCRRLRRSPCRRGLRRRSPCRRLDSVY